MLDIEARTRLGTYRRSCKLSSECEPPLGCIWDTRLFAQYCTDSQCTTDAQCPEDQVCQGIATQGEGPLVRFCIPVGKRQEGEHCLALTLSKDDACAAGLLCGGQEGSCARPCRKGAAAPCPDGFFCADTVPEPVCLPSCEARGCPTGQYCVRDSSGASTCAQVYGTQCQQSPCAEGQECRVEYERSTPGKVWMDCLVTCGEGRPACAHGLICDTGRCRTPCDPQGAGACTEGYVCKQHTPASPWVCQPDW
jgi:hypothetical protein